MTKLSDMLLEMPLLKQSRRALDRSPKLYAWLTISPVLIWVAIFTLFPFVYAGFLSLHKYHLIQADHPFVGLDNYSRVVTDDLFVIASRNTLLFTAVSTFLVIVLGIGVALLLNNQLRGFGLLRALVLLPWATPLVSAGILWKLMLHGNFGAVNGLLLEFGFIDHYMTFFSQMPHAFGSVIFAHVWREFPLATILFLAGLQTIAPQIYDAAKVDGAGRFARFWHVTLPSLRGIMLIVLVYETMIGLAVFDLVYVLTGGGPGTGTTLVAWLVWTTTFKSLNLGRGAALSFIMAIVLGALVLVFLQILRIEEEASS